MVQGVSRSNGMIYLDYNATTPVDPAVLEAMLPYLRERYGNPNSHHAMGAPVREAIERARGDVARLIGAQPAEVLFTSGGTESSNMAIKCAAWRRESRGRHLVTSAVEHPATVHPMKWLSRFGFSFSEVPVDRHGLIDPDDVKKALRPDTVLISVMHAQNEVGTIEPVEEIGRMARERDVLFHVDAAQSVGKVPVSAAAMHADFLSIAGHKFYGPKGIGALYVRRGVEIDPLIHGAAQEQGRRGGTENAAMIVGLGEAARLAAEHLRHGVDSSMRDALWEGMRQRLGNRVVLNGHPDRRLPTTLNVSFPGCVGGEILRRMSGVCASTGAACHAGDAKPSRVLTAMGIERERAIGAIRFSTGRPTTMDEIDQVVAMLAAALP